MRTFFGKRKLFNILAVAMIATLALTGCDIVGNDSQNAGETIITENSDGNGKSDGSGNDSAGKDATREGGNEADTAGAVRSDESGNDSDAKTDAAGNDKSDESGNDSAGKDVTREGGNEADAAGAVKSDEPGNDSDAKTDESGNDSDAKTDADGAGEAESTPKKNYQAEGEYDESAWKDCFLVLMPVFKKGRQGERSSADTFDYISFISVTDKHDVQDYTDAVMKAGFSENVNYTDKDGVIEFEGANEEDWRATVRWDSATTEIVIGCGFYVPDEEITPSLYIDEEFLEKLPLPKHGVIAGGDKDDSYVLYDGCSYDYALEYAKELKKAGFKEDPLEGDEGGIVWYIASDSKGVVCNMQYADGIIMIGCEKEEK